MLRQISACLRRPPREAGIAGDRWSVARVHRLLRKRFDVELSPRYALRRLREAGVRVRLKRAREPKLTRRALDQLQHTLRRPPTAAGLTGERWSRARIADLIERRFHRRFTVVHAGRLARRLRRRGLGRARDRRLTRAQARELHEALITGAGDPPVAWTRAKVAALIEARFGVRYHPQSIRGLLQRWKIALSLSPATRGDARPSTAQCAVLSAALAQVPSAAGLQAPRWEQRYIAQFLKSRFELSYPTRGLYRRIQRWGVRIPAPASAGGACPLTLEQRAALATALAGPPGNCGYNIRAWSRELVAQFILERFGIRYARGSIPHVLHREGLRLRAARTVDGQANTTPVEPHSIKPTREQHATAVPPSASLMRPSPSAFEARPLAPLTSRSPEGSAAGSARVSDFSSASTPADPSIAGKRISKSTVRTS